MTKNFDEDKEHLSTHTFTMLFIIVFVYHLLLNFSLHSQVSECAELLLWLDLDELLISQIECNTICSDWYKPGFPHVP